MFIHVPCLKRNAPMTTELYWLTLTALMTALFWVPYILDRIAVRGLLTAIGNPAPDAKPQSGWAQRAMAAHSNALENLVIFAALVLVAHSIGISNEVTTTAAGVYFLARFAHFVVYVIGIPGLRTLAFAVGWACQIAIGLSILGVL